MGCRASPACDGRVPHQNVFFHEPDHVPKIGDFGLSKDTDVVFEFSSSSSFGDALDVGTSLSPDSSAADDSRSQYTSGLGTMSVCPAAKTRGGGGRREGARRPPCWPVDE